MDNLDGRVPTTDILCAEKDDVEVEFAVKSKNNPIGAAKYRSKPSSPRSSKPAYPGQCS